MINPCERCNGSTINAENEYGEFICEDCEQNANERAWERLCDRIYGGSFVGVSEIQEAARRLK
jgi:Zn finger protein HypA/HybF involved in hydrogenase expression